MPGRSAVIVRIELSPPLASVRDAMDPLAARGVPAHVTVLFPFLEADALTPEVRSALARVASRHAPFGTRFSRAERRDAMVWLVPDGAQPFLDLTHAVAILWPEHPPYGGIHEVLIPHLTLVETPDGEARRAALAAAVEAGPFEVTVREFSVIAESAAGVWRTRWRLPMGDRVRGAPTAPDRP